jgi:hypothetical protein
MVEKSMDTTRNGAYLAALIGAPTVSVVYGITAVRLEDNQPVEVMMGMMDPSFEHWEHRPAPTRVVEVVDRLVEGDTVVTMFPTERGTLQLGPQVQVDVVGDGVETLALADDTGRRLLDLPRF